MTNYKKEINPLLTSIRAVIKEISWDQIEINEAHKKYKNLLNKVNKVKRNLKNDEIIDNIGGVLFNHNTNNFSKITVTYNLFEGRLSHINSYGDKALIEKINLVLKKNIKDIPVDELRKLKLPIEIDVNDSLYVYSTKINDSLLITASASSSNYFDTTKFLLLCKYLKDFLNKEVKYKKPFVLDYAGNLINRLNNLMLNNEYNYIAGIYKFKSLKHLQVQTMKEISKHIINKLKKSYQNKSHIFAISMDTYLTILDKETEEIDKLVNDNIDFTFNGLPLLYSKNFNLINSKYSYQNLIDKIFRT